MLAVCTILDVYFYSGVIVGVQEFVDQKYKWEGSQVTFNIQKLSSY